MLTVIFSPKYQSGPKLLLKQSKRLKKHILFYYFVDRICILSCCRPFCPCWLLQQWTKWSVELSLLKQEGMFKSYPVLLPKCYISLHWHLRMGFFELTSKGQRTNPFGIPSMFPSVTMSPLFEKYVYMKTACLFVGQNAYVTNQLKCYNINLM